MDARQLIKSKYGAPAVNPPSEPQPRPKPPAPWRDVAEVREFFDFLQELRDDGMDVMCGMDENGKIVLLFKPMPENPDEEWWSDFEISKRLFLETEPHIRNLMNQGKLRLNRL